MAIAILTENLAVHQSMADEPNGEDGLTAGEVKAKFDQAALAIQKYLNETVVPAVNAAGEGVRTVNGQTPGPDGNVVIEQGVAQSYVDAAVQEAREASVPRTGGQVTGDSGNRRGIDLGRLRSGGSRGDLDPGRGGWSAAAESGPAGAGVRWGQPGLCGPGVELAPVVGRSPGGGGGQGPGHTGQGRGGMYRVPVLHRLPLGGQCGTHGTAGGGGSGPVPAVLGSVRRGPGSLRGSGHEGGDGGRFRRR